MADLTSGRCGNTPCPNHPKPQYRVQVVEEPYSPEWPERVLHAGIYCSLLCALTDVNERTPKPADDEDEPF